LKADLLFFQELLINFILLNCTYRMCNNMIYMYLIITIPEIILFSSIGINY